MRPFECPSQQPTVLFSVYIFILFSIGCEKWANTIGSKSFKERVCYCDDEDTCNDGDYEDSGHSSSSAIKVCFRLISSILLYSLIKP